MDRTRSAISNITIVRAPRFAQRQASAGLMRYEGRVYPCVMGKNGISSNKREGDMKSPSGHFPLVKMLSRTDKIGRMASGLPAKSITRKDGWCDAPSNPNYNRQIQLPMVASHEILWREDGLYDVIIVLDHNYSKRIKGRGSAVFFHLTGNKHYTAGCIAIDYKLMRNMIGRISKRSVMRILL